MNTCPTENWFLANGLDDSRPQCVRTSAESEQLQPSLQANYDMSSVYQYVVPSIQFC
jgi:hypothetical protein